MRKICVEAQKPASYAWCKQRKSNDGVESDTWHTTCYRDFNFTGKEPNMYLEAKRAAHVARRRRAAFYLRINYQDGSDDIYRVLGDHGKKVAAKYERIVKRNAKVCNASHLSWAELQAVLAEKRHSLRVQALD